MVCKIIPLTLYDWQFNEQADGAALIAAARGNYGLETLNVTMYL
jgi:hypothetical protein